MLQSEGYLWSLRKRKSRGEGSLLWDTAILQPPQEEEAGDWNKNKKKTTKLSFPTHLWPSPWSDLQGSPLANSTLQLKSKEVYWCSPQRSGSQSQKQSRAKGRVWRNKQNIFSTSTLERVVLLCPCCRCGNGGGEGSINVSMDDRGAKLAFTSSVYV